MRSYCLEQFYPEHKNAADKKLLKVGQKVFVLTNDAEFEKKDDLLFQLKRLYKITQFHYTGNKIMLQYHLESRSKNDIDESVKQAKNTLLLPVEKELNLPELKPDDTIIAASDRNKEYKKRLYDFDSRIKSIENISPKKADFLKRKLEEYKTESSVCNDNNPVPILGLSKNNWNFLLENCDFQVAMNGKVNFMNL